MTDSAAVAWAAGVYEGEGSCHAKNGRNPTLHINMTDRDIVERIGEILPGHTYGPYEHGRGSKHKPFYVWQASSSAHAAEATDVLWPWLGMRRRKQIHSMWSQCVAERPELLEKHKDTGIGIWNEDLSALPAA